MIYQELIPPEHLRLYVRYFGLLESREFFDKTKTFKTIADGCPDLIFQENPDAFLFEGQKKLPQLFLHGVSTGSSQKTTNGNFSNIIVHLQPHAIKSIFGIDANELADRSIDLDNVIKNALSEQLLDSVGFDKKISVLSAFIMKQIDKNKLFGSLKAFYAVSKIKSEYNNGLNKIRSDLKISERTFERIFRCNIGISPKFFCSICRFQTALDNIRSGLNHSLTDIAFLHNYFDQSHFIRTFRQFTGASPREFISNAYEQVLNFPEWDS